MSDSEAINMFVVKFFTVMLAYLVASTSSKTVIKLRLVCTAKTPDR